MGLGVNDIFFSDTEFEFPHFDIGCTILEFILPLFEKSTICPPFATGYRHPIHRLNSFAWLSDPASTPFSIIADI
jgi:hypothetical protein